MQKLLLAATVFEVEEYLNYHSFVKSSESLYTKENTHVLISGIGLTETTFQLTNYLNFHKTDFVLQAGVAGSFNVEIPLGQLVEVISEQYGDLGAEDKNDFLSLSEMKLDTPKDLQNGRIINPSYFSDLKKVEGISVNTVAGNLNTIKNRLDKFRPDVETMEGFALFRVCKSLQIKCSQIRAISNRVEERNKANWKIQLALKNLNQYLISNFEA